MSLLCSELFQQALLLPKHSLSLCSSTWPSSLAFFPSSWIRSFVLPHPQLLKLDRKSCQNWRHQFLQLHVSPCCSAPCDTYSNQSSVSGQAEVKFPFLFLLLLCFLRPHHLPQLLSALVQCNSHEKKPLTGTGMPLVCVDINLGCTCRPNTKWLTLLRIRSPQDSAVFISIPLKACIIPVLPTPCSQPHTYLESLHIMQKHAARENRKETSFMVSSGIKYWL